MTTRDPRIICDAENWPTEPPAQTVKGPDWRPPPPMMREQPITMEHAPREDLPLFRERRRSQGIEMFRAPDGPLRTIRETSRALRPGERVVVEASPWRPPTRTFALPASMVEVTEWFKIMPPKGTTLILPLRLDPTDAEHDPTMMRAYITGMTQQVYLALIRLAQPNTEGRHRGSLDYEPGAVAELLGKRTREAGKNHRRGGYTNSTYRNITDCVGRLCAMGVERVGSRVVKNGVQSLVLEVEDESRGRTELHHSSLVWESMFGERADYVQVPDALLRLKTDDTAAGIAVARFWRRYVKPVAIDPGAPGVWRGTVSDLLNELDVDRSRLGHRSGVQFWAAEVERIQRVMIGSGMGQVSWSDTIPSASTVIVMEPAADVVASYRRPLPPAIPIEHRRARGQ